MSNTLRYALIGRGQRLVACGELLLSRGHAITKVVSDCPEVTAWTAHNGLPLEHAIEPPSRWLSGPPFDYLVSVVNHAVLPREALAAPAKLAVNYHDSLLPAYAGFNATAWAIIDGQTTHGITWHQMSDRVDGGAVLLQRTIDVDADDTAYTLGVKCSQAGIAAFAELVGQMERDGLQPRAQEGTPHVRLRSERPGLALLDFSRSSVALGALIRGLDFGPEDNWMATPKFDVGSGVMSVRESAILEGSDAAAGTVVRVAGDAIDIATADGTLRLTGFSMLDGTPADGNRIAASGIHEGTRLSSRDDSQHANAFDQEVSRSEQFWVRRLEQLRPATLRELDCDAPPGAIRTSQRPMPAALAALPPAQRGNVLVAAFTAYIARLTGDAAFDLGIAASVPASLAAFYAAVTPLRCEAEPTMSFGALTRLTGNALSVNAARRTYARDVSLRYAGLRGRAPAALTLPIAVLRATSGVGADPPAAASSLPAGVRLALDLSAGPGYAWVYDEGALSETAAARLLDRFDALLDAAVGNEECAVADLPVLSSIEHGQLLSAWQGVAQPYDTTVCVHEEFERQARRTPDAIALVAGEERITYRDLDARASELAARLKIAGAGPDVLVGICVSRSIDLLVGLLGILKAGSAYVPLDPAYPRERLALMLEDSHAPIVVTQHAHVPALPAIDAQLVFVEDAIGASCTDARAHSGVAPDNLAYVIFTSGSTGRPKGIMVEHRNVVSFFAAMDTAIGATAPGVWLAATSISFDISVLELLWTLTRGFRVVIAPESDAAALARRAAEPAGVTTAMRFGLFYFAADSGDSQQGNPYRLLIEGARFADTHGFEAVWTPERHFHAFGGLYPNPAVTTAALATITSRVQLRAGSVVLPLHDPVRVAEDWAVIDQLSGGRVGLSFASGWHVNDFVFSPGQYDSRREVMCEHIETVLKLWRGEAVSRRNGAGEMIDVSILPRPVQPRPPIWIASAGSVETFALAGRLGANVLTNMLGQDLADLKVKFAAYREARRTHGHAGEGTVTVMLHTFVCDDTDEARRLARKPFCDYLASSYDLVKVAPRMFPAFRQPSRGAGSAPVVDAGGFTDDDMAALMDHAFERYFDTAGLFGTPERAATMVEQLAAIGATEIACLIDFGIPVDAVLSSLPHLHRLQQLCEERASKASLTSADSIPALMRRHGVTHFQCTPSVARMLAADPDSLSAMAALDVLLVGGEALPAELANTLASAVRGRTMNMYGPTETTVWSTTAAVHRGVAPTIGRPVANTIVRILDARAELVPAGNAGEICIGGAGVARGYLGQPELTAERFIPDPSAPGQRLYRTGDAGRYRDDGQLEYIGRGDEQVKINGHRIELGDIERSLARHPAVHQCAVVARADTPNGRAGTPLSLVAYVVRAGANAVSENDRVSDWARVWNDTYDRADAASADPRFDTSGWTDSATGAPIPEAAMQEWLDAVVQRVLALRPHRIVEIGCGTGMLLHRVLPHVSTYLATDASATALDRVRKALPPDARAKVTLLHTPAHALGDIPDRSCDLVIINSVAQYFPGERYLADVVRRASEIVVDGGHVLIGDVRSFDHLETFHTLVEIERAPADAGADALRQRVTTAVADESELVVSPSFFRVLARTLPRLSSVEVGLKRGHAHNEITRFRYDVILQVGASAPAPRVTVVPQPAQTLGEIQSLLARRPAEVWLTDIPNGRLLGVVAAQESLRDAAATAGQLRQMLHAQHGGVDPESVYTVNGDYDVRLRWAASGRLDRFDALLTLKEGVAARAWPDEDTDGAEGGRTILSASTPCTNVPATGHSGAFAAELRAHAQHVLPAYMVPGRFVILPSMPLTPNGKVDRQALPAPEVRVRASTTAFAPPASDLERQIASVWRDLLNAERVGRRDNIFDLGANSLLTMQANNRISALLERRVPLISMFRFPTVESLAAHLAGRTPAADAAVAEQAAKSRAATREVAAERRRALRASRQDR